jgi:hypothetical protein
LHGCDNNGVITSNAPAAHSVSKDVHNSYSVSNSYSSSNNYSASAPRDRADEIEMLRARLRRMGVGHTQIQACQGEAELRALMDIASGSYDMSLPPLTNVLGYVEYAISGVF